MLFAPYLIRQAGGSALPDHIQPVLKFYLFIRSQSGNVHRYSPLSGFRVFGVNPKNSNPDFTGERHIFHYTFLFDAYTIVSIYPIGGVCFNQKNKIPYIRYTPIYKYAHYIANNLMYIFKFQTQRHYPTNLSTVAIPSEI